MKEIVVLSPSMRPQHIAAEYLPMHQRPGPWTSAFNEAAAYRCGILALGLYLGAVHHPSMRPQHIAAEYVSAWTNDFYSVLSFNEAAAYRCGILVYLVSFVMVFVGPSMRPQHIAAEYGKGEGGSHSELGALQ